IPEVRRVRDLAVRPDERAARHAPRKRLAAAPERLGDHPVPREVTPRVDGPLEPRADLQPVRVRPVLLPRPGEPDHLERHLDDEGVGELEHLPETLGDRLERLAPSRRRYAPEIHRHPPYGHARQHRFFSSVSRSPSRQTMPRPAPADQKKTDGTRVPSVACSPLQKRSARAITPPRCHKSKRAPALT